MRDCSRVQAPGKAPSLEPQSPASRPNNIIPGRCGPRGSAGGPGAGNDKARSRGPRGRSPGLVPSCPGPCEVAALTRHPAGLSRAGFEPRLSHFQTMRKRECFHGTRGFQALLNGKSVRIPFNGIIATPTDGFLTDSHPGSALGLPQLRGTGAHSTDGARRVRRARAPGSERCHRSPSPAARGSESRAPALPSCLLRPHRKCLLGGGDGLTVLEREK